MRGLIPYRRSNGDANGIANYFDDFEKAFFGGMPSFGYGTFRTDVMDKGDHFLLKTDLPGVAKEDIHLDIHGDDLMISVQHEESKEEKKENFLRRERAYGSYCRSFDISDVDADKIKAAYHNGVLELTLPKRGDQALRGKQIQID
ncbi:18 kDa heat shock protein [bioreactor metagenome]|uniref:18 kDa heat shock protein n=1 Tax=bioreactor metagenome TaxID=1076179 RepID=A0A645F2T4_9ZZZZ|nr:Hsp20/alpha crystallin family protein [Candidatus Pelethousia sp.]